MIKLPRLGIGWDTQPGLFQRYWNDAMTSIEKNINDISTVIGLAGGAQSTADTALANAALAQGAADDAQIDATTALTALPTKVDKNDTPTWVAASGALTRNQTTLATATISNPPTQAEVQSLYNYVVVLSAVVTALVTDLEANEVLKT